MRRGTLLLDTVADTPSPSSLPPPHHLFPHEEELQPISVDSDTVVILASLLCALICVAGLALVARCACRGRSRSRRAVSVSLAASSSSGRPQPLPRGLEKAAIEALPTVWVSLKAARTDGKQESSLECCAICLAPFAEGDQLRVLPHCAHGFHAACVDTWLAAHASCPFCRATIVSASPPPPLLCRRCGAACCDQLQAAPAVPHPLMANGQRTENRPSTSQIQSIHVEGNIIS